MGHTPYQPHLTIVLCICFFIMILGWTSQLRSSFLNSIKKRQSYATWMGHTVYQTLLWSYPALIVILNWTALLIFSAKKILSSVYTAYLEWCGYYSITFFFFWERKKENNYMLCIASANQNYGTSMGHTVYQTLLWWWFWIGSSTNIFS